VDVVVPHVLVPSRLVVLAGRHARTLVGGLERERGTALCTKKRLAETVRKLIEVLVVIGRDDEYGARVVGPPLRRDVSERGRGALDDMLRTDSVITLPTHVGAEWTPIASRSVRVHSAIIANESLAGSPRSTALGRGSADERMVAMSQVEFEHLVVVCGMPGAGKTWLAERLAPKVGYPLLSRDVILASLYEALPAPAEKTASEWSLTLGTAAFSVFLELATWLGPRLILDAHFQARFGGDADIRALAPSATQIYLHATDEVIHRRHHERYGRRRAAHRARPLPTLDDVREGQMLFAPLELGGPLLSLDSSHGLNVDAVADWIRSTAPNGGVGFDWQG
jgi:predicted kinase